MERALWAPMYSPGHPNFSNRTSAASSRFFMRFWVDSVRSTFCRQGSTPSSEYACAQIFSMPSQSSTTPRATGCRRASTPRLRCASWPTNVPVVVSPIIAPITRSLDALGQPTMEGNTQLGSPLPAKPARHIPEPPSITTAERPSVGPSVSSFRRPTSRCVSTGARVQWSVPSASVGVGCEPVCGDVLPWAAPGPADRCDWTRHASSLASSWLHRSCSAASSCSFAACRADSSACSCPHSCWAAASSPAAAASPV
mmetsp:Transcript_108525/g.187579  ORF Transcript_108525/g.187579 Transcript_108525/m.187579 type:complete len:255 (+) Transcript_108525:1405-2169(+)